MDIILKLSKKLAGVKDSYLLGAVIIRAELEKLALDTTLKPLAINKVGVNKKGNRLCFLTACDLANSEQIYCLKITMLLNQNQDTNALAMTTYKNKTKKINRAHVIPWRCFSSQEVQCYLTKVGDTNPIHQGEQAIIPGLMVLSDIFVDGILAIRDIDKLAIRFIRPIATFSQLDYIISENKIDITSENILVAEITVN